MSDREVIAQRQGWCPVCSAWSCDVERVSHDDEVDGPAVRERCVTCGMVVAVVRAKDGPT